MTATQHYPSRPTQIEDLIQRSVAPGTDPKEKRALQALATDMIHIFKDEPKLLYMTEAARLSSVIVSDEYQTLTVAFANAIIQGTTDGDVLDPKLLENFRNVLRRAPRPLSAEGVKLGSVLSSLQTRLEKAGRQGELETQYHLVCTLSIVLDAMIDQRITGLSRELLHEPLHKQLELLKSHQEPRLAQVASYAYQALRGVPDDEGPYQALWRCTYTAIRAAAIIAGAVPTMDLMRIIDSTPDLIKLLQRMKDLSKQKGWYAALRYTDMLIEARAFHVLETFVQQKPCQDEQFLCGLFAQLEQAWVIGDTLSKCRVVQLFEDTLLRIGLSHRGVREWIKFVAGTLGRPQWKDALPDERRRWMAWKTKKYQTRLHRFYIEATNPETTATHLLERAWLHCDEAQMCYADNAIREHYADGGRLDIKRLSGELLDMDQCYINLAVIEHSQEDVAKRSDSRHMEHQPSAFTLFARLKVETTNREKRVTLTQLFKERRRPDNTVARPRRVLIRGRAGVGKTTLCKKIVHDFLRGHLWGQLFDRVLWISLRNLKGKSCLKELLHQEYFPLHGEHDCLIQALWKTICDQAEERTLLILDGLDELSGERNTSGIDLTELFKDLLNRHDVIITSRPYAVQLPGLSPFDLELETIGFDPGQVQAYLTKVVDDKDKTKGIQSFIKSHFLIQGLVQIPIQLDALCYSWDSDFAAGNVPETMTALYQAIESKLWKKDFLQLSKVGGNSVSEFALRDTAASEIKIKMKDEDNLLQLLAFTGIYNDIIEFSHWHRDEIRYNFTPCRNDFLSNNLVKLSFLRTSESSSRHRNRSYHFLHLTFQEFFAAQYFVRCWTSEETIFCLKLTSTKKKSATRISPERFLQQEKYSGRYDIFWRFVAGLLQHQGEKQLYEFFEKLEGCPQDLLGPAHQRLLMHCFSEVTPLHRRSNLENLREEMEARCKKWTLFECKLLKQIHVCRQMEFPEHVVNQMLADEPDDVKILILRALSYRSQLSPSLLEKVATFLRGDVQKDLEQAAADALGKQLSLPENILQALVSRLEDDNVKVRVSAANALGQQSSLPENVLHALVSRLGEDDWHVRGSAINALGEQCTLPDGILHALACRLEDDDWHVRRSATSAIGKQSSLPDNILHVLVSRLKDNDSNVRASAVNALGKQSSLPDNILHALVSRLEDTNPNIRWSAANALSEQSSLPKSIMSALVARLEDNNSSARESAANALGEQSFLPINILHALVSRLKDDKSNVRWSAANAIGKQCSLPDNILNTLAARLEDDDWHVRMSAANALGKQSGLSSNILHALVSQLQNDNWNVRRSATSALGKQSSLPDNILHALVSRLEDNNSNVRMSAASALGKQSSLTSNILHTLVTMLEDDDGKVRISVANALGKQHSLPETVLHALVAQLNPKVSSNVSSMIEMILRKHDRFYFILPHLDKNAFLTFYKIWVEKSIQEQFSCYIQDSTLNIDTSHGRRTICLQASKDVILKAVLNEISAMGCPNSIRSHL